MTEQNHAMRDDIAFMRQLAEEGRQNPIADGSILVALGAIYAACSLATWAAITYGVTWSLTLPAVWFGGTGVFLAYLAIAKRGRPELRAGARTASVAWAAMGWAIFAIVVSLMVMSVRAHAWWLMAVVPSVVLAIYGAAWFVAAVATRTRWLFAVAFGSFALAIVNAWFATDPATLYLIYAASLLALLSAPGFVLMRRARQAG